MEHKLQLLGFIIIALFFIFFSSVASGQSLSAGDVAFAGFNSDASGNGFTAVLFHSVSENQEIHFNSQEWDGSSFSGPGGDLTWVAPSGGLSAGAIVTIRDVEGNPSVNIGSITDNANMNLSDSGEVIYAYTGADKSTGPFTFLGAIATAEDKYNKSDGSEGTLANTGLSKDGHETILLPKNIDNAEYIGTRDGVTAPGYRKLLNNIGTKEATDDNWAFDNSNSEGVSSPQFNSQSFNIITPPTIAFTVASIDSAEGSGMAQLTVELVEANGTAVSVDVIYLASSSTASPDDINNFSKQTVSFSNADGSGAKKTVNVTLNNDTDFEGSEKAVFRLQNNSTGTVLQPEMLTLNIADDDAPNIVINEVLLDPGSVDVNGDGDASGSGDEFIEIVNNENNDIDISNWTLSDENSVKFEFPLGTVLPANSAAVIFGSVAAANNFGGAYLYEAGSLGEFDGSDSIILRDRDDKEINKISYSASQSAISLNRNSDQSGADDSFIKHSSVSEAAGNFSPGTKVDGSPFGSKHAIGLRGSEGWRMISSPVQTATFNDFFDSFWMQGIPGSDAPGDEATVLSWNESSGTYAVPANMSQQLTPGKGYFVYVFEDEQYKAPGVQGGFPKIIQTEGNENSGSVTIDVSATDADQSSGIDGDEGWNMLGNPFAVDLSVSKIREVLEAADPSINANIYVWDHDAGGGNGNWKTLSDSDLIAPFQGFFIRYGSVFGGTQISLNKNTLEVNSGEELYKNVAVNSFGFELSLHGEKYFDTYAIEFNERGTIDLDRYDAHKLNSLNANSINVWSLLSKSRLQKNVLPEELDSKLEIPIAFQANGRSSLSFQWGKLDDVPRDWDILLKDNVSNRTIDLRSNQKYQFSITQEQRKLLQDRTQLLNKRNQEGTNESRFILSIQPNTIENGSNQIPNSAQLEPNYPNPFNPTTTIPYVLNQDSDVVLTVWNMIGQKVATLVDGRVEAGEHDETWNAQNMPSGIYIARFEVNGEVFTRKMTLIK